MKVLRWIAVALALLVVVAVAWPTEWHATASVVIAAPPADIHPYVQRPRTWVRLVERYSATTPEGKAAHFEYTFGDVAEGAGAWWISESNAGGRDSKVRIEYTAADPQAGVDYEGRIQTDEVNSHGFVHYEVVEGGTRVTWDDRGNLPRGFGLMTGQLNGWLTQFFGGTLEELKTAVEAHEQIPDAE